MYLSVSFPPTPYGRRREDQVSPRVTRHRCHVAPTSCRDPVPPRGASGCTGSPPRSGKHRSAARPSQCPRSPRLPQRGGGLTAACVPLNHRLGPGRRGRITVSGSEEGLFCFFSPRGQEDPVRTFTPCSYIAFFACPLEASYCSVTVSRDNFSMTANT